MNESEFTERIQAIKDALNLLGDFQPLMVSAPHKRALITVAANIMQIEEGIKRYSRPKSWELVQEGV